MDVKQKNDNLPVSGLPNKPDLIIGTVVFVLVIQGAIRILKLGKYDP